MSSSHRSGRSVRNLALTLAVAATLASTAAVTPAAADHEDPAGSVTLVGSFQTELGCPADWSPACAATAMEFDDGVGSITVDVPAGAWEWKVALDGSVGPQLPGGQRAAGAGRPCPADVLLRRHVAPRRRGARPTRPRASPTPTAQLAGTSLRDDLTRERFYFVMADRFENGDPTNDTGGIAGDRLAQRLRPHPQGLLPRWRHRRPDVAARLHRGPRHDRDLADAGVQEPAGAGSRARTSAPATTATGSPTSPRSTPTSAPTTSSQRSSTQAHARGIKVFFDIITNHTADVIDYEEGNATPTSTRRPSRTATHAGDPFDDRDFVGTGTFPPLDAGDVVPVHTGVHRRATDETVKVPGWLNDPTYYHNRGNTDFAGEDAEYGDFFGLDDLFTEHPDVVDGMTEIYQAWVDFGIDGFRIDTVKHVNVEFWQAFAAAIAAQAEGRRKRRLLRLRRGVRRQPGVHVALHDRGRPAGDARLRLPGQGQRVRPGRPDRRAARPVRRRRLLHRHRLQRLLAADVPRQPRHGPHRPVHRRQRRDPDDDAVLARDQPRPLADVPLARPAGRVLRRRAGLHRRRRRPGRPPGHVPVAGRHVQRRRPDRHRRHHRGRQLRHRATRCTCTSPTCPRLRSEHPALADGAQIHRYASGNAGVYAFSRIDADDAARVRRRRSTTARRRRRSRSTRSASARQLPRAVAGRHRRHPQRPRGSRDRHRAGAERGRVARHVGPAAPAARAGDVLPHAWTRRHRRRPGRGRRRCASRRLQPGDARLAPGGHRRRGRRSAPTTTRRTASSTT